MRQYGPHDETTAGNAVVILHQPSRAARPTELVVPMPEVLRRQFRARNTLAYEAGLRAAAEDQADG